MFENREKGSGRKRRRIRHSGSTARKRLGTPWERQTLVWYVFYFHGHSQERPANLKVGAPSQRSLAIHLLPFTVRPVQTKAYRAFAKKPKHANLKVGVSRRAQKCDTPYPPVGVRARSRTSPAKNLRLCPFEQRISMLSTGVSTTSPENETPSASA